MPPKNDQAKIILPLQDLFATESENEEAEALAEISRERHEELLADIRRDGINNDADSFDQYFPNGNNEVYFFYILPIFNRHSLSSSGPGPTSGPGQAPGQV